MYRSTYPDLDVLDSPLLSPTPLTALGGAPGSALAERIFNDPQSWEQGGDPDDDIPTDPMAWFVEEVERFRANSAATDATFSHNLDDALRDKIKLMPSPSHRRDSQLKSLKRASIRPISLAALFDRPGDDFTKDIHAHLAKVIESGGGPQGIQRPFPSAAYSTPSTGSSASTMSPLQISTASSDSSSIASPVAIHSASTTLSFLEWYGIYPDSPRVDPNFRKSIYAKSRSRTPAPVLHIPSPKSAHIRPSSLLSPTPSRLNFEIEVPNRVASVPPPAAPKPPVEGKSSSVELTSNASPEPRLSTPPGLSRSGASITPAAEASASRRPGIPVLRDSLYLTAPPPYVRTPSPSISLVLSELPTRSTTPAQDLLSSVHTACLPTTATTPMSTPVRRLPSIPPESGSHPGTPSVGRRGLPFSCHSSPSPLPSSLPTSPDAATGQTLLIGARPLSAVRSPLGGPAGPRSRASTGSKHERNSSLSKATGRSATAPVRRPPILHL